MASEFWRRSSCRCIPKMKIQGDDEDLSFEEDVACSWILSMFIFNTDVAEVWREADLGPSHSGTHEGT